ncbi:MAG TPA: M20 family metallopeptidase [Terriglobia bacterium]|nr:M20 family metallopeptidase [Terriglobia bacterium]
MPRSATEPALDLRPVLNWCISQAEPMLRTLRHSVEIESPSQSKTAVTRVAEFFARELKRTGGKVQTYRHARAGAAVAAEFWGAPRQPQPILLLGHTDTVWDVGTLSQMLFRVERGRAYGPGILDMKSGLIVGLFAIRALRALNIKPRSSVRFFLNADEETGSTAFRSALLREARRARACLVLEPAAEGGAVKTARKGVGVFTLAVRGRSAHAGINPAAGVNAISELAKQIARVESFARPAAGLTVNVGVAQGGSRSNVVPETASASIDVRVERARDGDWIEKKMRSLKPILRGARLEMTGGMNRPPLERRRTAALFECARGLASQLGFALHEASTGGGSDGSFVAALGVPTLDGLGGVGDGAHARHEHVLVRELPRRAALLAALLATI